MPELAMEQALGLLLVSVAVRPEAVAAPASAVTIPAREDGAVVVVEEEEELK